MHQHASTNHSSTLISYQFHPHHPQQLPAEESMEEALECEAKSTAPSKAMRKRMGELGAWAILGRSAWSDAAVGSSMIQWWLRV